MVTNKEAYVVKDGDIVEILSECYEAVADGRFADGVEVKKVPTPAEIRFAERAVAYRDSQRDDRGLLRKAYDVIGGLFYN